MRSPQLAPLGLAVAAAVAFLGSRLHAQSFTYTEFSDSSQLKLNGSATIQGSGSSAVLQLTPSAGSQAGSAFSLNQVQLQSNASFSTEFTFRMDQSAGIGDEDGTGADGIVFVVQPVSNSVGGAGGGIGYQGIPTSLGIEFDTYDNGEINGNHVGVDLNGGLQDYNAVAIGPRLNNGDLWYAWVDYDGTTGDLQVRLTDNDPNRPVTNTLEYTGLDLPSVLGTDSAYVGFTAGTGSGYNRQDILSWQFNDTYQPIQQVGGVPDTGSTLALAIVAATGLGLASRRRIRRTVEV